MINFKDLANIGANSTPIVNNDPVTPYINNVPEGHYNSKITDVDTSNLIIDNSSVKGYIVCYHELTDESGNLIYVRFHVYEGTILNDWIKTFMSYGYNGDLTDISGVCEDVEIKHGKRYAYISSRKLASHPSVKSVLASSASEDSDTSCGMRSKFSSTTLGSRRASLLDDDDMDDDDILTEED